MANDYPTKLYKYRNWTDVNHKNILLENQLYLASPKDFNDPFDCRIAANFKLLDTKEKIQRYIDEATIRHFDTLMKQNRDLIYERKRLEDRFMNNIEEVQRDYEAEYFNKRDLYFGIVSMSSRWNSILMWSHYSDSHKGICVGFWEEKLRKSGFFGAGAQVRYHPQNEFPQIDPFEKDKFENILTETQSKAFDWSYEKEFRLSKLFYPKIPSKEDRTVVVPDDFFSEIILGLNIPEKDEIEIIDIAKAKNIKVYKAKKVPFKFEIDRFKI